MAARLLVAFLSASALAGAQSVPPLALSAAALPDTPSALPGAQAPAPPTAPASISGQVEDFTGAAVPGALIKLDAPAGLDRTVPADATGAFRFEDLPPGTYRVTATAPNMGTYVSAEIRLAPGEALQLTKIALAIGPTHADVQVIATPQEIAAEQVHEQEQQRVFGLIPNFYTSYLWDAAPMDGKQKFGLALHSIVDPFAFVGAGIVAGVEQARNTYPGYGQEAGGYGKRYGAAYVAGASSRLLGSAILPTLLHQDPRYFYKGSGTDTARALYAIRSAFVVRGDSGHLQPNYSYILGAFASGAVAYALHPAADRSSSTIYTNASVQLGVHVVDELLREFVVRRLTPKIPSYKTGQPPASDKP